MSPHPFLAGLDLAERFYHEVVAPLISQGFPGLRYSAGLIGPGSEVLGFDTLQSTDHHWGPRVMVFVADADLVHKVAIETFLAGRLPPEFGGWSTHWGPPDEIGVRLLAPVVPGQPVAHRVEVCEPRAYLTSYLGVDPMEPLSDQDWMVPTDQKLRTLVYGRLFRDDLGLQVLRTRLTWFPEAVWREKMARLWQSIADEEPFLGRCGDVGDDRGSRLVAARLVDLALHLAFYQAREYPPYSKWFGTAFQRLASSVELGPVADEVLRADHWRPREAAFNRLTSALARGHNRLGLTVALDTEPTPFWGRPYRVIHGDRFAQALRSSGSPG